MESNNGTFDQLTLSLELQTNTNKSEWELAAMTIKYKIDSAEEQTDDVDVAPRRGYFLNAIEAVCAKVCTTGIVFL